MDRYDLSNPHQNWENPHFLPADFGRSYDPSLDPRMAPGIKHSPAIAIGPPPRLLPGDGGELFWPEPVPLPSRASEPGIHQLILRWETAERRHRPIRPADDIHRDALTGFYNRSSFIRQLDRRVEEVKYRPDDLFGVLLLDLDRFKLINDSFGHQAGDRLLVALGQRIRDCIWPGNTLARLGGDEFAILLDPIQSPAQIFQIAETIQKQIQQPVRLGDCEIFTTASIGIALGGADCDGCHDILRDADTALYRAKIKGKARHVIFNPTMHRQARERLQLENDLRDAIARQELLLHYQPIISPTTRQIVGCEALVRWCHPRRGLVSPAEFIPIAEEIGWIEAIGEWVLRQACTTVRKWQLMFPQIQPFKLN